MHRNIAARYGEMSYFNALVWGKKWAYRHAEMYEMDLLSDSPTGYINHLGFLDNDPAPRPVMEFLAKEMFKGQDAELIRDFYSSFLMESRL